MKEGHQIQKKKVKTKSFKINKLKKLKIYPYKLLSN